MPDAAMGAHWMPDGERSTPWLVGLLLFALGVAVGLQIVARCAPVPEPPLIAERLAGLDANRDAYDTLFFGSSRIFRGVDPAVFDRTTAALGEPTRSFNLGFPAMRPHEAAALLRRVLARRPARLRWVLIELADWSPDLPEAMPNETFVNVGRYSARALAWHDTAETRSVLRSIAIMEAPLLEKLRLTAMHLTHWGAHVLHVGDAANAARRTLAPEPAAAEAVPSRRGYTPFRPIDYSEGFPARFRRNFEGNLDLYRYSVGTRLRANAEAVPIEHYNVQALEDQIAAVRAADAAPVYVLPPRGDATPVLYRLAERGLVPALLDLNDTRAHPELFEVQHRFDQEHLNPVGAELFSRRLGEAFAAWQGAR